MDSFRAVFACLACQSAPEKRRLKPQWTTAERIVLSCRSHWGQTENTQTLYPCGCRSVLSCRSQKHVTRYAGAALAFLCVAGLWVLRCCHGVTWQGGGHKKSRLHGLETELLVQFSRAGVSGRGVHPPIKVLPATCTARVESSARAR